MPARTVRFGSSSLTQRVSFDRPVLVRGFLSAGTSALAVVSLDPSLTLLDVSSPSVSDQLNAVICILSSAGILVGLPNPFPVSAGEAIYVANSGKCSVMIFYDETQ